jgi:hypothetical protein
MTKSRGSESALVAVVLIGGTLLLAGCPASQPPQEPPAAEPAAPPKIELPKAEPPKPEEPKSAGPKSETPKASELPTLPALPPSPPAAKPMLSAPAQPAAKPRPAAKPATPTTKPTAPATKDPAPAATTAPAAQAAPPNAGAKAVTTNSAPLAAVKPMVKVEKAANAPASPGASVLPAPTKPVTAASVPLRSTSPASASPTLRPVPLPISPAYSADGGWTARPNPLRGDKAPAQTPVSPPAPAETKQAPSVPATTPPNRSGSAQRPTQDEHSLRMATAPGTLVERHVEAGMGRGATKKTDFDPIKENGAIFVGWSKPRAALVITGRLEGYIEPCGCAGLDRMKGGIGRRHTFIEELRTQGWPVVCLDVGGISKGFGRQAELKFQTMVEAFKRMGYNAIGLGSTDLRLPGAELLSVAKGVGTQQSPFLAANVGLFTFDPPMIDAYRVVEAGGLRIGITAVLGTQEQRRVQNGDVLKEDPGKSLTALLPKLKREADYLVLLAYAGTQESIALGRRFPEFQMVVTAGGAPEPPAEPALIDGKTLLVEVGEKGMNAIAVGLYDDPARPWRYQRVPLDSRFKNSPDMRMLMESYQDQLKTLGFAGLGLRTVPHPQKKLLGNFVGSAKCEACHEASSRVWKKSGHARAFQTLASLKPPRDFDPECISCHVIGWHPQDCFPYEGGYANLEATPNLINVGCESCHGPGGAHVAAEQADDEKVQGTLRRAMAVTKEEAQQRMCGTCHDGDNSPDFKFEAYWPKVEHHEEK